MDNSKITMRLTDSDSDLNKAGEIIRRGGLVAFPTETVYGLGADALNPKAVKSVYAAKGRPSDNPMIVHISDISSLDDLVDTRAITDTHRLLMTKLWPGPITFVFRKSDKVPYETTGGLDTVGIRMPADDIARRFITASDRPIAAPSANISGRPSPTTYRDVAEDMDGRIDAIIMGEDSDVGIESTVLDLTGDLPVILRPGYITKEILDEITGLDIAIDPAITGNPASDDFRPKSPGMKYKHYSPKADVIIIKESSGTNADINITDHVTSVDEVTTENIRIQEIIKEAASTGRKVEIIDYQGDSKHAARDFFARLRQCDRDGVDIILVRALDERGLGFSVMNRMLKSAGYSVVYI